MAGGGLVAVVVRNQTQKCWQNPSAQSPSSLRGAGCLICDGVAMGYRGDPSLHAAFGQKGRLCVLRTAWPCHFPSPCTEFDHAAAAQCWTGSAPPCCSARRTSARFAKTPLGSASPESRSSGRFQRRLLSTFVLPAWEFPGRQTLSPAVWKPAPPRVRILGLDSPKVPGFGQRLIPGCRTQRRPGAAAQTVAAAG